jgi:hypothetical protein
MLTINSKDRSSGSSGNFLLKNFEFQRVDKFKIEYIHLPYSWYTITSLTNQIRINGSTTVSISAGQYNASNLAAALQTSLQIVDATFTCVYSSITGMFTIARSTNFTMNLSSPLFTMRRQLGFNGTLDTSSATSQTSDSVANLHNGNSISLHSNILSQYLGNQITDNRSEYVTSIPITVNMGNLLVYSPPSDIYYKFREQVNTRQMTLYLKDIDGNIINLNGCEWEMKLIF